MTQGHTADRSLQFLMKWSLSSQCMHSCFVWCSATFFSDTHCALHLSSVSVIITMVCLMGSQFMLFMWDCCVMMIVVIQHSWVTAFWIEFKLWLTHCSKVMYSSYNTKIEMTIRAHMSVVSRLLLRNVFLTASSHFKPSAFNSICSKVVRCLANGFLICFRVLRYESLFSSILSHCTHVEADWSASQWLYGLKLCLAWYKPQFKVWPDLEPTLQVNCVSIRTAHWHCCLTCSHSI
jgi:hypothetical protein